MAHVNLLAGWVGILVGFVAGAIPGLYFHDSQWLGGYGSWRRRMIRLAHISFFGIGLINLAFALTVGQLEPRSPQLLAWSSGLLLIGAITMPLICYLAAFRRAFRHVFFVPVISLVTAVALFVLREVAP